ncbi:MAG: gamma-glutamyltransferase, partial [Trichodesmium sp. St7_bin2_1]|nr:gamma-glutamyltransferase [Trichodesmium sp. St7_bin2_1]
MIATSHPLAAKIGLDTMSRGGNAIDAAISAALMLTLCEPQSTGLYGDAFVILKSKKSDKLIGINGSGSSPRAISSDLLLEKGLNKIPINSVHSITLPGAVALFEELALKFSNLGLTELCRAPIKYAEEGVVVSPRVAFDWRLNNSKFSQTTKKFYLVNGKVPEVGSIFRAPKQAEVLRKIQKSGSKGFYQSEVAEDFVRSLQRLGGVHTLDDFAKVTFEYVDPIFSNFQDGSQLFELPPNGQGITAIMIRKLMEICNIQEHSPNSVNRVHLEAEIAKLAYTARNRLIGDPQFSQIKEHFFLESAFLEEIAQGISVDKLIDARDIQYFDEKQKDTVLISAA